MRLYIKYVNKTVNRNQLMIYHNSFIKYFEEYSPSRTITPRIACDNIIYNNYLITSNNYLITSTNLINN